MNNLEKLNNLKITMGTLQASHERRKNLLSKFDDFDEDDFIKFENDYKNNMETLKTSYFKILYSHIVNTYIPTCLENSEELTVFNPSETQNKNTYVPIPQPTPEPTSLIVKETPKTEISETTQNTLNKLDELKKEINQEKPSVLKQVKDYLPQTPQEAFYKCFLFTVNKVLISLGLPPTHVISPFLQDPTKNWLFSCGLFGLWYFKPTFFYFGAGISYLTYQKYVKKTKDVDEKKDEIVSNEVKLKDKESPDFFDFCDLIKTTTYNVLKSINEIFK